MWSRGNTKLEKFLVFINQRHLRIQFTTKKEVKCQSIFLICTRNQTHCTTHNSKGTPQRQITSPSVTNPNSCQHFSLKIFTINKQSNKEARTRIYLRRIKKKKGCSNHIIRKAIKYSERQRQMKNMYEPNSPQIYFSYQSKGQLIKHEQYYD